MLTSFLVSFSYSSILILPGFVDRTVLISHFSGGLAKRSHFGNAQICVKRFSSILAYFLLSGTQRGDRRGDVRVAIDRTV